MWQAACIFYAGGKKRIAQINKLVRIKGIEAFNVRNFLWPVFLKLMTSVVYTEKP